MARLHKQRIIIANIKPQIDCGRYPIKRIAGDTVTITADIFRDGHDPLTAVLKYRTQDEPAWTEVPLKCVNPGLDLWTGEFRVERVTTYHYTIEAWTDVFGSWRAELKKKSQTGVDVKSELMEGIRLIEHAAERASGADRTTLISSAAAIKAATAQAEAVELALADDLAALMNRYPDRETGCHADKELQVVVDRERARFAAWYELFPRSQGPLSTEGSANSQSSGTFRDCIRRLPDIQQMGFDVIYLPPIHPIGRSYRKGKNNSLTPAPTDPGSPWAIGNELGGHKSIEPSLGTLADFEGFVRAAKEHGIEVALDFAMQCSPDHPYVREHPEWFYHRPDGTIKYAENPPKKYQDIYPVNFDTDAWPVLWEEMKSIVLFWIERGVTTFRVDNPHTKPIHFWEWLIAEVKKVHPEVNFLSEAFTRPKVMKTLAKAGFTQSYTYFTWRNEKKEIIEYLTELTQTEAAEYLRGNFFANTPDILHAFLQKGGRPAFKIRHILAATLSSVYGIYSGFELCENTPLREGSEEYLDSEKYQIKPRDWDAPGNIKDFIAKVNRARQANPALQLYDNLRFHLSPDPNILCYSKATPDKANVALVVANLDPHAPHEDVVNLDLAELGLSEGQPFRVEDQISGSSWTWQGSRCYVRLDPQYEPAHLFVVRP